MFEYEQLYYHNPSTYDNIENFVSIYNPIEIILIYSDEETIDSIIEKNIFNNVGKKARPAVSTKPTSSAPTKAPRIEPMPPITIHTSTRIRICSPMPA